MRHIIGILLQNEAGALTRVAGMFSSRGYNIESLAVAPTDDPTVSRLTLVTSGSEAVILQIANQLKKLIDVVSVEDMTRGEHIERELVLIKLRIDAARRDTVRGYVVRTGGRVLDPSSECFIVELLGSEAEINGFMRKLATHAELVEVVRSGALGISRERNATCDWWTSPRRRESSTEAPTVRRISRSRCACAASLQGIALTDGHAQLAGLDQRKQHARRGREFRVRGNVIEQ